MVPLGPKEDCPFGLAVPVDYTRRWIAVMKDLGINYKYDEMPGEDHGTIIAKCMPAIFAFFKEHTKP